MKDTLLIATTIAAISCASISEANSSILVNQNNEPSNSDSSLFKNMAEDVAITTSIKKKFLNDDRINSLILELSQIIVM